MNIEIGHRTENIINVKPDIRFMGYNMMAKINRVKLEAANVLNISKPFLTNVKIKTM